jgi:hypothetical protein
MDYQRVNFASVGVTGLIRREIGEVAVSPNLRWHRLPVKSILEGVSVSMKKVSDYDDNHSPKT